MDAESGFEPLCVLSASQAHMRKSSKWTDSPEKAPTVKSLQKVFTIFEFYWRDLSQDSWLEPLSPFPKHQSCLQYCDFLIVVSKGREGWGQWPLGKTEDCTDAGGLWVSTVFYAFTSVTWGSGGQDTYWLKKKINSNVNSYRRLV